MVNRVKIEDRRGAVVDSVKDAASLNAIVRGAARGGHALGRADAADILFALYAMPLEARGRLAARLMEDSSGT
jgi:hypothetical protein